MFRNLKYQLFNGWNLTRWIRLGLGIALVMQAVTSKDMLFGIIALFLIFQALSNTGSCGPDGCNIPSAGPKKD